MRVLLFIFFSIIWCVPSFAEQPHLRLLSDTSETWQVLQSPQEPATDREILALRAVVTETTATQDKMTAYYLGKRDVFDIVSVDEAPEEAGGVHAVSSYQFRDRMIVYETRIKYVTKPNPEYEQIAREIALDYLLGRNRRMPIIFNERVYDVEYNGKCAISVIEMADSVVQFTYRYNSCK
ncbi:MAG: hypothetical protein A2076_07845 [Geobacteraceae bacterium GWC2_53_11]|nr:MAG: hypothetical protein A2076_07845 [Geobacteraceae bacterium GWC2_53_11]